MSSFLLTIAPSIAAPDPAIEKKVDALLARMTLEEKIGQMSQSTAMRSPMQDSIREEIKQSRWGSFLNAGSVEDRRNAQRIATEESRLKIPLIFGRDVIHGYRTIFPIPLGQSCSWDPELIERAARVAAGEASGEGIHWAFAPMVDIARDPRWGRVAEGFGEDPYLVGMLGAAIVRGYQGKSLTEPGSVAASVKHFVGYGAAEAGRDYNTTWIPEVLLRDVYLRPFRAAIDAGVKTLMTSFNAVNGVPASGNMFTLDQILRREWKFDGLVVSDYESVTEMIVHGYAEDRADAALKAVRSGVDMEMVSTSYFEHLKSLVETGKLPLSAVDTPVRRILRLKHELGLFENPMRATKAAEPNAAGLDVAKKLAMESAVLLKNERGVLPLSKSIKQLAVIGQLAESQEDLMGTWVMDQRASDVRTPLVALREMLGAERVKYVPVYKNSRDSSRNNFAAAREAASQSDAVVLFLGEEAILSGEAHARAFLGLPGAQEALGTMGGPALASLLFGDESPSGRLTMSFPRTVGQVPIYYNALNTGRPASPGDLGIPVGDIVDPKGYVSKYLDVDFTPEYPFGFGLSYTTFTYANLKVSPTAISQDGKLTVSADVTNTGSREGTEVVQLYVRDLVGSVSRPVRELKGFRRVKLAPKQTESVTFTLTNADLAFCNAEMKLAAEPGKFQVWVAPDSAHGLQGEFQLQ